MRNYCVGRRLERQPAEATAGPRSLDTANTKGVVVQGMDAQPGTAPIPPMLGAPTDNRPLPPKTQASKHFYISRLLLLLPLTPIHHLSHRQLPFSPAQAVTTDEIPRLSLISFLSQASLSCESEKEGRTIDKAPRQDRRQRQSVTAERQRLRFALGSL